MKTIKLTSLFTISLTASFLIFMGVMVASGAWNEPGQAPPGGNVAAPLNAGSVGQEKVGGLILNTGGASVGLYVNKNLGINGGQLQLGSFDSAPAFAFGEGSLYYDTVAKTMKIWADSAWQGVGRPASVCVADNKVPLTATCPEGKTIVWGTTGFGSPNSDNQKNNPAFHASGICYEKLNVVTGSFTANPLFPCFGQSSCTLTAHDVDVQGSGNPNVDASVKNYGLSMLIQCE